jgi:hypothetical protein
MNFLNWVCVVEVVVVVVDFLEMEHTHHWHLFGILNNSAVAHDLLDLQAIDINDVSHGREMVDFHHEYNVLSHSDAVY